MKKVKELILEFSSLLIVSLTEIAVFLVNGLASPFKRAKNSFNVTEESTHRQYVTDVSIKL